MVGTTGGWFSPPLGVGTTSGWSGVGTPGAVSSGLGTVTVVKAVLVDSMVVVDSTSSGPPGTEGTGTTGTSPPAGEEVGAGG